MTEIYAFAAIYLAAPVLVELIVHVQPRLPAVHKYTPRRGGNPGDHPAAGNLKSATVEGALNFSHARRR